MLTVLDEKQIQNKLSSFRGWEYKDGVIKKTYRFSDWQTGLQLANLVSVVVESVNHHPEIVLRFGSVQFKLTTHDAGGVTEQDIVLAGEIEKLAVGLV